MAITTNDVSSNPTQTRCTRYDIICDQVCQPLTAGRWFSLVSSIYKTVRHDITELFLKVALNTIIFPVSLDCQFLIFFCGCIVPALIRSFLPLCCSAIVFVFELSFYKTIFYWTGTAFTLKFLNIKSNTIYDTNIHFY